MKAFFDNRLRPWLRDKHTWVTDLDFFSTIKHQLSQYWRFFAVIFLLLVQVLHVLMGIPTQRLESINNRILIGTEQILKNAHTLLAQTNICLNQTADVQACSPKIFLGLSLAIEQDLQILQAHLANEKVFASITAIPAFNLLNVSINQYQLDKDIAELYRDLTIDIPTIEAIYVSMQRHYHQFSQKKLGKFTNHYMMITSLILIIMLFELFSHIKKTQRRNKQKKMVGHYEETIQAIQAWDKGIIENNITNLYFSSDERKTFAKILKMMENKETLEQKIDLYAALYNVISYEIRNTTNKIKGGIDLITSKMDEELKATTRQITLSADMLQGLANNFNQLFSHGGMTQSDVVKVYDLIIDISMSLTTQVTDANHKMETYFERNIIPTLFGNYTSFYWFLLLQLSNEITTHIDKNVVLIASSHSADDIDKITLCFDMVFTDDFNCGLSTIREVPWKAGENSYVANRNLMRHLFQDKIDFSVERYQYREFEKIQVLLQISPQGYPTYDKPLKGKKMLLCGHSVMTVDIVAMTLESYGVQVQYAKTANDTLKMVSASVELDAVFIVDALEGTALPPFCKTLHHMIKMKRMDIKCFMSTCDAKAVEGIQDQFNAVFYRPCEPKAFISTIEEVFSEVEVEKTIQQKKIIVTEDDHIQQMIMGRILDEQELQYICFETGEAVLAAIEAGERPLMIFMDCIMPGMGGIEATRRIRLLEQKLPDHEAILIVGVSALTSDENKQQCMEAGMDLLISKPYQQDEISKILRKYTAAYNTKD